MKIVIVGGDWNNSGGKPSGFISKFANACFSIANIETGDIYNGGNFEHLECIKQDLKHYDIIFWMANIPNEYEKNVDIKQMYPEKIVVYSKRNNNEYTTKEIISKALSLKANLLITFTKNENLITSTVLDPLGNLWFEGTEIHALANALIERLNILYKITREKTFFLGNSHDSPLVEDEFINYIKKYGEIYHSLMGVDTDRLLGNASFRCLHGFPSKKISNNQILVSQRNVLKTSFSKDNFVLVEKKDGRIYYYGQNKPSVDTPVQIRLYESIPDLKYIIHSHCYIDGARFTDSKLPCGAIEEVGEILKLKDEKYINLLGHGSIVLARKLDDFKNIEFRARPIPER